MEKEYINRIMNIEEGFEIVARLSSLMESKIELLMSKESPEEKPNFTKKQKATKKISHPRIKKE